MITGKTVVAGVVGRPVAHSLSPILHNAWLKAAGIDGVYVAFAPDAHGFERLANGFRGGAIRGVNVTLPFKEEALNVADRVSDAARAAAAANLLLFGPDGRITADNTDGFGLLRAFGIQQPWWGPGRGPVTVLGAGGAARGAVAALLAAGAPRVWVANRTVQKAEALARALGPKVTPLPMAHCVGALRDSTAVVNATSAGLSESGGLDVPLETTPEGCVVMDMLYKPLETPFLARARALGRPTVDGLEMLIRQAEPSFEAFYGQAPPAEVDVRALAQEALGRMKVIGLTGSIGMGKSTTAAMFREAGIPVYDADAAVHDLYDQGGAAVGPVGEAFPGVVRDGRVDREELRKRVLGHAEELKRLNAIVHPLVGRDRVGFFKAAEASGADMVVLDVPLLFETGGHANVDAVVVVSAPAHMQRERVLARPGMTPERLDAILAQQLADAEKRARAHYVVDTGQGLEPARQQVQAIIADLRKR